MQKKTSLAKTVWKRGRHTIDSWQKDDGPLMAAAVAYYSVLALFPLLMILTSGLGLVLQWSSGAQDAQQELLEVISQNTSPQTADRVGGMLREVRKNAPVSGPIGLGALLVAAIGLFANFEKAFDRIWNVEDPASKGFFNAVRNALWQRGRAFLMLLGLGFAVLVVFVAGLALSTVRPLLESLPLGVWVWTPVQIALSLLLNWGVFTVLYRLLPKPPVRWSQAARGALLATVLWEIARQLLAVVLANSRYNAYGIIGSLLLVMLWIYAAATVIFLGAEYVQMLCETERSEGKGES